MTAHPVTSASNALLAALPGDWPGLAGHRASCPASSVRAVPSPLSVRHRAGVGGRSAPVAGGYAACGFGPAPRGATAAREFAGRTLREWRLTALADNVAIIVSELVGNALRYGVTAFPRRPSAERPVRLGLLWQDTTLLCAVSDPSCVPPVVREPDHLAERGRGLHIVDSLSQRWGWSPPGSAGKTVWATVRVDRVP